MSEKGIKPVPKHIRDKMHRIAKLSKETARLSLIVDKWFEEHGCDIERMRSGNGRSLEELEYGNDVTGKIIWDYNSGVFRRATDGE
jgi:hypothetical protein